MVTAPVALRTVGRGALTSVGSHVAIVASHRVWFREVGRKREGTAMASSKAAKPVVLHQDKREKAMYEDFGDLFAIIKTTEKLERAYVRDAVSANEYEPACQKLLAQFKTLSASLKHTVPDVEKFIQTYNLDCPLATRRLIHVGMPATLELGRAGVPESRNSAVSVAETVQYFITAMDSLKLNMVAVDQVFPILSDLLQSMHRVAELKPDFAGKIKMKEWIGKLHAMPASQELQEDEVRQLLFDLEFGYNAFMASLGPQTSFGNSP